MIFFFFFYLVHKRVALYTEKKNLMDLKYKEFSISYDTHTLMNVWSGVIYACIYIYICIVDENDALLTIPIIRPYLYVYIP